MALLQLIAGLGLLLGGGFAVVQGASQLARRLGVPSFVVGLTVVAFGTSAPELAVNSLAALRGTPGISFGNVVGSNLANLGLILGVAGLMAPLRIGSVVLLREIPMMLLATAAAIILGMDSVLRGAAAGYDRADGLVLLLFFTVFLYTAATTVLRKGESDVFVEQSSDQLLTGAGPLRIGIQILGGLAGLVVGADLSVDGASTLAAVAGVPPSFVGLTIVAIGTSLPELAASIVAMTKGETDLAVGNVVGSNIFNLLFILGVTSTIAPVPVPSGGFGDLLAVAAMSLALLLFSSTGRHVGRNEALVLVSAWIAYGLWRIPTSG
jgi:cation:H+ antiporter